MEVKTNIGQFHRQAYEESTNLSELLLTLIVAVVGMLAALYGIYSEIPAFVISGIVVFVAAGISVIAKSGKSILEFVRSILDFMDYLKERRDKRDK